MALAGYFHDTYIGTVSLFFVLIMIQRFFGDASYAIIEPYLAEVWPIKRPPGGNLLMVLPASEGGSPSAMPLAPAPGRDEEGSSWEPLSVERGVKPGQSAVTVFAGFGLQGVVDQKSRDPEGLSRRHRGCHHTSRAVALYDRHQAIARKALRHRATR